MKIIFVFLLIVMVGCKEAEISENSARLNGLKVQVLEEVRNVPYGKKQQELFKAYFSEIQNAASILQDEEKLSKKLNKAVTKVNLEQLCVQVLLPKEDWTKIVTNCTRNKYFLCADDVKNYVEALKVIRGYLELQNQQLFDNSPSCANLVR